MAIVGTILLTILKIILIILCVIAALLCLILFVPVKYELSGAKDGADLSGSVEVTFLFRAIIFRLRAEKRGDAEAVKSTHFYIFGIDPKEWKEKRRQKKKEAHHKKKKAYLDRLKKEDPEKYAELKREAQQRKKAREAQETAEKRAGETLQDKVTAHSEENAGEMPKTHPAEEAGKTAEQDNKETSEEAKKEHKVRKSKKKLEWSAIPYKIIEGIGRFFSKLCHISNGLSYWISFLTSPLFLNALHHVSGSVIRLLKALLPKHLFGRVEMGFDDPSMTGRALAFACAYLKAYGPDFYVIPDFDQKKLEGNASCTGQIRLILPARLIVSLLLDRNVRQAYHIFKNRKEEA